MQLTLFHNSDKIIKVFSPENTKTGYYFLWLSDRYFHYPPWYPRYIHIFFKGIELNNIETRLGARGYDQALKEFSVYKENSSFKYAEPPIVICKEELTPDLILDSGVENSANRKKWKVIFSKYEKLQNKNLNLRDENNQLISFSHVLSSHLK